jgi:hypothetical protein
MKTSIFSTFFTLFFFVGTMAIAQQSSKILVQSYDIKDMDAVNLDIPNATFEIKEWNNLTEMRIQLEISANMPEVTFKSIIAAGRYNLLVSKESNLMTMNMSGLKRQVVLMGRELKEKINCIIFVPAKVKINTNTTQVTATDKTAEATNVALKN